jgi:hypothetical protein
MRGNESSDASLSGSQNSPPSAKRSSLPAQRWWVLWPNNRRHGRYLRSRLRRKTKTAAAKTKHANPNAPVNTDSRTSSSRALPLSESWPYRAQIDDLYSPSTTLTRAMRVRTGTTLPRCRFGRRRYSPLPHRLHSGRRSVRVPRAAAGCRSGRYARLNP